LREQPAAARRDEQTGFAGVIRKAARPVAGDRALAEGRQEYLTAH
jgi:hypothetical protein